MAKGLLTMFTQVSENAQKVSEQLHKPSGVARKVCRQTGWLSTFVSHKTKQRDNKFV